MTINKMLTTVNYNTVQNKQNQFIVIHYVGATGGAEANCRFFKSTLRNASAHYFVGHEGEIWQCVEDNDVAWHCGAKSYRHPYCRNNNSIGIELCCRQTSNGTWYFEEATVRATIELVKELMNKYGIPVSNVIRHYDVTGKVCPEPYVRSSEQWNSFKAYLTANTITPASDSTPASGNGYLVKVTADVLNVRRGAGVGYAVATTVKKGEIYTIVDEYKGWGKLKSGAGWIKLSYTKRVQ